MPAPLYLQLNGNNTEKHRNTIARILFNTHLLCSQWRNLPTLINGVIEAPDDPSDQKRIKTIQRLSHHDHARMVRTNMKWGGGRVISAYLTRLSDSNR